MNLIPMQFENANIRVVTDESGEPWFVGKDVCDALGYANPNKVMNDHCKGVTKRYPLSTAGGMQEVRVLSEPDVLRLIVRSTLPAAERFERWVFEDVLPTIRKTGGYGKPAVDPMRVLNDPVAMRGLLLTYSEKMIALEGQVAEQEPKVQALDRISSAEGSLCMRDAAKDLQIRPIDLKNLLITQRWIYGRPGHSGWLAYQDKIQSGLMCHKVTTVQREDGTDKIVEQVRITPKGLARLAALLQAKAA